MNGTDDALRRRDVLKTAGVSLPGVVALSGCTQGGGGPTTNTGSKVVKIGFANVKSGPYAEYTQGVFKAQRLAVDLINEEGMNIGGTTYKYEKYEADSGCAAETGRSAMKKLLGKGVELVSGPTCSAGYLGALPVTKDAKIPQIVAALNPKVVSDGHDYTWQAAVTANSYTDILAKYIVSQGHDKLGLVVLDAGGPRSATKALEKNIQKWNEELSNNVEVSSKEYFGKEQTDFLSIYNKLKSDGVDAVVEINDTPRQVAAGLDQLYESGLADQAQIYWNRGIHNRPFLNSYKNKSRLDGIISFAAWLPEMDIEPVNKFQKAYTDKYGSPPGLPAANQFDLVRHIYTPALEEAGVTPSEDLQKFHDTLDSGTWGPGVMGGYEYEFKVHDTGVATSGIIPNIIRMNAKGEREVVAAGIDEV